MRARARSVHPARPKRPTSAQRQRGTLLSTAVRAFPSAPLSWGERLDILDAWALVLDGVYAHLPLKRSLYGFDVLRAIEHLRQQVPSLSDLQFHRELTLLINRLRDAHTQYLGPKRLHDAVAALPFLVEVYGPPDTPQYVVSKVNRRVVRDRRFRPGVLIKWWNGIPFDRAVDLHAERETGGRADARRARALESLTLRALDYGPPPDEDWVVITYLDPRARQREIRLDWRVVFPGKAPTASHTFMTRARRGINLAAEAARRAKKLLFNFTLWNKERAAIVSRREPAASRYGDFLSARSIKTRHGTFGYLRIWSFDVEDDQEFLEAAIKLMKALPDRGLIIDVRDNPGGYIGAAERMLQLFTPSTILPTKFALRATPVTSALSSAAFNQRDLGQWAESLATAAQTGEPYSSHLPLTSVEACNDLGQYYGGPVVVVTNANTYSSGDLFAAGIVDNRIGTVICVGEATGAGGANVWTSDDLDAAMRAAGHPVPLPKGVSFMVAVRRAVRSGDADGVLIEDAGVRGQPYAMTRRDIFDRNRDLIEHCGEILAAQPRTRLRVARLGRSLALNSAGLDRLDVYVDGHPAGLSVHLRAREARKLRVPRGSKEVEIVGFAEGMVRQRRRLPLDP
jgi:C-terminal processing protease CtpA/Prc